MKTPLLLIALTLWACDTLECGPGTHRERDLCVANARVVCADGTALVDGRCVAVEGDPPAADATIDAAADVDATPPSDADVGSADAADAARLDDADVAPPDHGPPPQLCPPLSPILRVPPHRGGGRAHPVPVPHPAQAGGGL